MKEGPSSHFCQDITCYTISMEFFYNSLLKSRWVVKVRDLAITRFILFMCIRQIQMLVLFPGLIFHFVSNHIYQLFLASVYIRNLSHPLYTMWSLPCDAVDPESVAALQKVEALTDSITVNWTAPTSVNIDFFQLGIKAANSAAPPKASNVAQ